jgi:hypothetical protein
VRVIAGCEAFEHATDEVEVHPADDLALLFGESVEGTVDECDLAGRADHRVVALTLEDGDDVGAAYSPCGRVAVGAPLLA